MDTVFGGGGRGSQPRALKSRKQLVLAPVRWVTHQAEKLLISAVANNARKVNESE